MLPRAVSDHYRAKKRLTAATLLGVRYEWLRMTDDLDRSWALVGPRIAALIAAAQLGAAKDGAAYVAATLEELGRPIKPIAQANVSAFAGRATSLDGIAYGSLDDLLYGAVVRARTAPAESLTERLTAGQKFLDVAVQTQISDASRQSASVAINARPKTGWIRMVNPPCCQRCAVLAGKLFKANDGFDRHPGCDCEHIPYAESDPFDPGIYIGPDDVKDLNSTQRRAIADGADMNQVINAKRKGQVSADGMYTREGTTRRGWTSHVKRDLSRQKGELAKETGTNVGQRGYVKNYRERRVLRPTPEAIYRFSDSREEAIALLKANGYFV